MDPDKCDFGDVHRVLRVLDDYALKHLAKAEHDDRLPSIIRIQRFMKSYIICTRLQRCARKVIKMNKF